jgi:hypothetical protein
LCDEFLISIGIENLRLEGNNTNHEAVQHLHGKVLCIEDIATIFTLSFLEELIVPSLMLVRILVYFSKTEHFAFVTDGPVGHLGQDLE